MLGYCKTEDREIDLLFTKLQNLKSVTIKIQRKNITSAEARTVLVTTIATYPSMKERLKFHSEIVADRTNESSLMNLQDNRHGEKTAIDQDEVEELEANCEEHAVEEDEEILKVVEIALKKRRLDKSCSEKCLGLRFILPTSNIFERWFLTVGFALIDCGKGLLPSNLYRKFF